MTDREARVPFPVSPCVGICLLEPATRLCRGCLRTVDEIRRWYDAGIDEKYALLAVLAARRAAPGNERDG